MEGYKLYQRWKTKLSKENIMVFILLGLMLVVISLPSKKTTNQGEGYSISEAKSTEMEKESLYSWGEDQNGKDIYENLGENPNSLEYGAYLEASLEEILAKMEGVGEAQVMITFMDLGEKTFLPKVEGIVVVAEGAGTGKVSGDIVKVVETLFDLEAHKIKVVKKGR